MLPHVDRARDLLKDGDNALVIFTRDLEFNCCKKTGNGSSGNWPLSHVRMANVNKVIIYNRPKDGMPASIYEAKYIPPLLPTTRPDEPDRSTVAFADCEETHFSQSNWRTFAETWTKSIRYLP